MQVHALFINLSPLTLVAREFLIARSLGRASLRSIGGLTEPAAPRSPYDLLWVHALARRQRWHARLSDR